jgi:ArsR family transcriptional regulator
VSDGAPSDPTAPQRWLAQLADPTRLRLLTLLQGRELTVSDLCHVLQMPQSTVSRHLKVLGEDGWLVRRREGATRRYRLHLDELPERQRRLWELTAEASAGWATLTQDRLRLEELLRARRDRDARGFFEGAAAQWDALRHEMYGPAFTTDALLALLPGGWTVADLGCGSGAVTAALARHVGRVIAVDHTPAMLAAARQRLGGIERVELVEAALERLPIEAGTCDAALLVLVLSYLRDPLPALREAARVLRTGESDPDLDPEWGGGYCGGRSGGGGGGRLVVVDLLAHDRDDLRRQMGQHHAGFAAERLRELLESAGFADVRATPLPLHPAAKAPALQLVTARRA